MCFVFIFVDEWINSEEAKKEKESKLDQSKEKSELSKSNVEEKPTLKGDPEMVPLYLKK